MSNQCVNRFLFDPLFKIEVFTLDLPSEPVAPFKLKTSQLLDITGFYPLIPPF